MMRNISIRGIGLFSTVFLCLISQGAPAVAQAGGSSPWIQRFQMDLVVVVLQPTMEKVPPNEIMLPNSKDAIVIYEEKPCIFQVTQVLKGDLIEVGDYVEVAPSEPLDPKRPPHAWLGRYGLAGNEKTKAWNEAIPISATFQSYAEMLVKPMSKERRFLEYYRFWKTDDDDVRSDVQGQWGLRDIHELLPLRTRINHDFVVRRARDAALDLSTRRFAFQLLAIAGDASDKQWLPRMALSPLGNDHHAKYLGALQHGAEHMSWLLHEFVTMATAPDNTRFDSARAVGDFATSDL